MNDGRYGVKYLDLSQYLMEKHRFTSIKKKAIMSGVPPNHVT